MIWLVTLFTNHKEQIVIDAYMGTGTTGVACIKCDRKFIGFETDNDSFITAEKRLSYEERRRSETIFSYLEE